MDRRREIERLLAGLSVDLDRREFLRRAAALGISATTAGHLIEALKGGSGGASAYARELLCPRPAAQPARWLSHPPHRVLPTASNRPLADTGRSYFVAPDGSDESGDGSEARPWRSWRMASTVLDRGDTLYHRGGIYWMRGNAVWNKGGVAGAPVTLRAYPGELAILTSGNREFHDDPQTAWEPMPVASGGVADEYRSTRTYELLGPTVVGRFADSMLPLFRYTKPSDLRSENEYNIRHGRRSMFANRVNTDRGLYCGPGLWGDTSTGRIHVRLSHTSLPFLDREDYLGIGAEFVTNNYRGEIDPRNMPLIVSHHQDEPGIFKLHASFIHVFDLVFACYQRIDLGEDDSDQLWDNCEFYCADANSLNLAARNTRVTRSRFRGVDAPWTGRFVQKNRTSSPISVYITGTDFEFDHNEVTDTHDAILIREKAGGSFHHNLVECVHDDALKFGTRSDVLLRVYQNILRMNLSYLPFHFGIGVPETGDNGIYICRNLFEMRPHTLSGPPDATDPAGTMFYDGYNLRMEHNDVGVYPRLFFYHNTVLAPQNLDTYCQGIAEKYFDTTRAVLNNIFLQERGRPVQDIPRYKTGELIVGHNLQWSRLHGSNGSLTGDVHADPLLREWNPDWRDPQDFRLQTQSPARGAGKAIPSNWFDPLRDLDPDHDLGAIPAGFTGTVFGPDADI